MSTTEPASDGGTTEAIVATDLVKSYGKVHAVAGVSFGVPSGTVFGLLGPNGAGKTTTVKMLTTLTRPDSGTAEVAGYDIVQQADQVRESIGVVSQKGQFDPEATGRENLMLQGRLYGVPRATLKHRIEGLLAQFGLSDAGNRLARKYSGGMQRKLDVALGLVHTPKVLFLDEPTTGLDPEARAEMWRDLTGLATSEGLTILLTTHYLDEADQLAAKLAIVDQGRIVATGSPEELKAALRGDAIAVEFGPDVAVEKAQAVLAGTEGLRDIVVEDRVLRARADHGASAVPGVLAALDAEQLTVASVTIARPSLDDVYLRHTGRTLAGAEAEVEVNA